jgi:hypothetical protein
LPLTSLNEKSTTVALAMRGAAIRAAATSGAIFPMAMFVIHHSLFSYFDF